jgi:hypothetical protein
MKGLANWQMTKQMHYKASIAVFTILVLSVIAQTTFAILFLDGSIKNAPLVKTFDFMMGIWAVVNMAILFGGIIVRLAD